LVYGSEVKLPIEVDHRCFHTQKFNEQKSEESRISDLDQLEELRGLPKVNLIEGDVDDPRL
jgi:hypothetical protein